MTNGTSALYGKDVSNISAGGLHTCAIASDSLAYCWGYNINGQLGDNSTTNRNAPVAVNMTNGTSALYGKTLRSISTNGITETTNNGYGHTCAIASDSLVYCWGYNAKGQIGNNTTTSRSVPTAVESSGLLSGKAILAVSNGPQSTCSVASDGNVYCWGYNGDAQLGDGTNIDRLIPVQSVRPDDLGDVAVESISAANGGSCMIAYDNQAFCWGLNSDGALGIGINSTIESEAVQVVNEDILGSRVTSISVTGTASLINNSGEVWRKYSETENVSISSIIWEKVSTNGVHTCAISSKGSVYCWGLNDNGQLGDGSGTTRYTPVAVDTSGVLAGKTIKDIAIGLYHSCVIASDNLVYCWGGNWAGQLGNSSTGGSTLPVAVNMGGLTALSLSAGREHSCIVASDNQAYCWGSGSNGRLGNNSTSTQTSPVAVNTSGVLSGKTIKSISAGSYHTCAVASDSRAYCWGYNNNGQLGDDSRTQSLVPVSVDDSGALSGLTIKKISTGAFFTCTIASDSRTYCWGTNSYGQYGNNSTSSSNTAVATNMTAGTSLLAGKTINSVQTGGQHTCVVASDGGGYCWGQSGQGQLGNGPNAGNVSLPVRVIRSDQINNNYIQDFDIGDYSDVTCMISSIGSLFCTGENNNGMIGNDSTDNVNVPTTVVPPLVY